MAGLAGGVQELTITDSIHICHTQVPKSIILQIFQYFDKETLRSAGLVSKTFYELSKHPSLWTNAVYSGCVAFSLLSEELISKVGVVFQASLSAARVVESHPLPSPRSTADQSTNRDHGDPGTSIQHHHT